MHTVPRRHPCLVLRAACLAAALLIPSWLRAEDTVRFNRDIRPILSDTCYQCHGPDAEQRQADLRLDQRTAAVDYGAIVPGDASASLLVERITSEDPEMRMPPPEAHKTLSEAQRELLIRWIDQGAVYEQHWSYEPPVKAPIPEGVHPIDYLISRRLSEAGGELSPPADRRTLARRLYMDLIGLPPTPEQVDAFVHDSRPDAYARLVECLLASPHYGERMALGWLDVVRFADTIGYHSDNPRNVWPYRDYVIRAFNTNKPFDAFTIEQLAGDLLPGSTQEQKVASAFNRLLLTTEEGGAQPKDYEARMLADRVRAVGTVWLGQTLGCCQCHDHKYDPASIRDFYAMGAFFADIQEPIIGAREPGMLVLDDAQRRKREALQEEVDRQQEALDEQLQALAGEQAAWEEALRQRLADSAERPAGDPPPEPLPPENIARLLQRDAAERDSGEQAQIRKYFVETSPLLADARQRLDEARKALSEYEQSLPRCLVSISMETPRTVRVLPRGNWMDESGPIVEPAFLHYLPHPEHDPQQRLTRLDLAQWIVSPDNPLTARVFVNRLWYQFFGAGLCRTLEDLGSQGEWPAHPELLDWLACEFMESGWDVKHMVRLLVSSRTYQQTSVTTPEAIARDPENRQLARQSRFRLDAELIRDYALAVSGLLDRRIGGPSVKPYQPAGYWENLNFPPRTYQPSEGADQYRRGLYTWWQRSFLHPSLLAFDAPTREECAAQRTRSNIPQQALVLLNDPTYVEAARVLAARTLHQPLPDDAARLEWAWRQVLQRGPTASERSLTLKLLERHRQQYEADPEEAAALLEVGQAPVPGDRAPAELAAWTSITRVLLNLHETITRN